MVITPKEARVYRTKYDQREIVDLEKTIDKHLREEFNGEAIQIPVDYGLDKRIFQEIKTVYGKAGWNVKGKKVREERCDQREGSYNIMQEYLILRERK
jgi:hypothetical protein